MPEAENAVALPPARALAWSENLLDQSARQSGPPALGLWLPQGITAALGISQNPETELDLAAMERDGVKLIRRQSGGGAVLLYAGVLCWEALAPREAMGKNEADSGIRQAYAFLCGPALQALRDMGLPAFQAGICDLSLPDAGGGEPRKIAGTAQLRRRDMVLVHGSLLVAPDLALLPRYLKFPGEQPEYRRGRSHRDFCISLAEALADADGKALISRTAGAIAGAAERLGWKILRPPVELSGSAAVLEKQKYRSAAWNRERKRDWA